jgi:hypothetical protein
VTIALFQSILRAASKNEEESWLLSKKRIVSTFLPQYSRNMLERVSGASGVILAPKLTEKNQSVQCIDAISVPFRSLTL